MEEFVEKVLSASSKFSWIKRREVEATTAWASIRLWLNESFVDIFYRKKTGSISYAYVEGGKRVFGANNMRIGWHLHPFGEEEKHVPIEPLEIEDFLKMLEEELKKRKKLTA